MIVAALLGLAAAAAPATPATTERTSTLVIYGNDPCPKAQGDEIVVCARQPESERYRIPKPLRARPYNAARDGSWAGTVKVLDAATRDTRPNSCSPTGSWGQTGCFSRFMAEAAAQRQADEAEAAAHPQ